MASEERRFPGNMKKGAFNWKKLLRTNGPTLFINIVSPLLIYSILTTLFHVPVLIALLTTCFPSLFESIRSIMQQKHINMLALVVLLSIGIGLVFIALGVDPNIFLAREAFFTLLVGVAALASLPFPKPLGFYALQRIWDGGSPERTDQLYVRWHYPSYRTSLRMQTAIAGIGIVAEGVIRIFLTSVLPPLQFLSVSPFITLSFVGMIVLSITGYTTLWFRRHGTGLRQFEQKYSTLYSSASL